MSETRNFHASAVALGGRGVLILGPSGAGKSTLAIELLAFGADLISDDIVQAVRRGQQPPAEGATDPVVDLEPPAGCQIRIEARGMGVLAAPLSTGARLGLVVDLSRAETERLPPRRSKLILDVQIPLVLATGKPGFAAALALYLRYGRQS